VQYHQRDFQPRTRATHETHCSSLGGPLHDHIATTYGVARDAVLNELQYFHVTNGLAPDVMHDLLEGVLPLCMKHLLKQFMETGVLRIQELNRRIDSFQFGPMDTSNRPRGNITSAQLHSGELKQSGKYLRFFAYKCTYVHTSTYIQNFSYVVLYSIIFVSYSNQDVVSGSFSTPPYW
jgi:hypothetical protein